MYLIVWCRISKNQFRVLHSRIRSEPPPSPPSKNIDADIMCGFVLGQISRVIFTKPTIALQRRPLIQIILAVKGRELRVKNPKKIQQEIID